ncbi:BREX-1 system adenine-specific DNA-methyltransferase PglX [Paenibacillus yonginensis]|uniref:BREX-1 system adenine-specific DNA-methyltransferase PglX n=1 Tax=Paenibacillus yonginensis TaxID=1462996 RepID=UPI001F023768|nr:BREX-1 system adenine-specific DNA-methyltransferase PglX [Paenibacillus yonginensis]
MPAATQLFTPDWIVRYMVENSLGRLWLEGHPNDELRAGWKYYLDEAEQEPEVQAQLEAIREQYKTIKPEDIKVIDPCMGSGHILVYAFDILMQIYESYGYSQRDSAKSILEHNLYGLDIDKRAYQLAYFAVMMKARQYNRRILNGETKCHLYTIQESNGINREQLKYFGVGMEESERKLALHQMEYLLDTMHDAKEFGSILIIDDLKWDLLEEFVERANLDGQVTADTVGLDITQVKLRQLVQIAAAMALKYDVVITNPPYMGSGGMGPKLADYVKKNYPDNKSDLFAVFIERCGQMTKKNCFQAMITQHAWMFLSSFRALRAKLLSNDIINMIHLGAKAFEEIGGEVVQTTSFVIRISHLKQYKAIYHRLVEYGNQIDKQSAYLEQTDVHYSKKINFSNIEDKPIVYWLTSKLINLFEYKPLSEFGDSCKGVGTGNNNKFIREWFEVSKERLFEFSPTGIWYLYKMGGEFRKWYGNNTNVVLWKNNGEEIRKQSNSYVRNSKHFFEEGLEWTKISSNKLGVRYMPPKYIFDDASCCYFCFDKSHTLYILGYLNSSLAMELLRSLNPTLNYTNGTIAKIPINAQSNFINEVSELVKSCIDISKNEWDCFEVSLDFLCHPLIKYRTIDNRITEVFELWVKFAEMNFYQLKSNEEELNRIFIEIYGLQDELTPEVEDKEVTIRKADLGRDVRSFLSYAVGCMFGRYSLDVDGLAYAGGEWDSSKYKTFIPDKDNVIPITDEEYFEDDIVGLFCAFLKKTFGEETLEENLDFIAKALGNKGNTSREVIRNYFLKDFFKDHCKVYQKRPIYWLFDSGKADGFKALVYMHRYNADTIGNLRIDYLHRMQRVYDSEIARMQETIDNSGNAREVAAATKRKEKLTKQLKETKEYDEKIAHLALARIEMDLDDGVKVNYEKVQTAGDGKKYEILAKI